MGEFHITLQQIKQQPHRTADEYKGFLAVDHGIDSWYRYCNNNPKVFSEPEGITGTSLAVRRYHKLAELKQQLLPRV